MRKSLAFVSMSALVASGVGALLLGSRGDSAAVVAGGSAPVKLRQVATIVPDASGSDIHFRSTSTVQSLNGSQFGNEMFTVPGPVDVAVWCITDDLNPGSALGKWYYVSLSGAPYPDTSGYVWGNIVKDAPPVPACTPALVAAHPFLPGTLSLARGPAHGSAYWYAITLRGLHPNFAYTVGCYDDYMVFDVRHTDPFRTFTLRTDSVGDAFTDNACFSGEGERHWVKIGPYETDFVEWTAPPPPTTPSKTAPPTDPPTNEPPPATRSPEPTPTTAPPADPSRVVTVQNQVTNGAQAMREDSTPAYLSSRPAPFCKRDGCAVPGTDMGSGATITAVCQIGGPRMTNGQDDNGIDDANPGLATSSLWYRARTGDGHEGFIAEVYLHPGDRGGLGLPTCS